MRESWIRAKYVQKAFIKKLPGINKSNNLRKWSVRKKIRHRPAQKLKKNQEDESEKSLDSDASKKGDSLSDSEDLTSGFLEGGSSETSRGFIKLLFAFCVLNKLDFRMDYIIFTVKQ